MNALRCWLVVFLRFARYLLYRVGLTAQPTFMDVRREVKEVVGQIVRRGRPFRVVGKEHCPMRGPAVFAGNHMRLDDPCFMFIAVSETSDVILPHAMMRDDFFEPGLLNSRLIDGNEILQLCGGITIHRDRVTLSQLRPFVRLLRDGESFMIFPGRTRTRSGLFFEYRDEHGEPGSVGFLIAQAQRGHPNLRVAAVPMARSYNPVSRRSTLCFGEPLYLPPDSDRARLRELDFQLLERIGSLAEINVPQVLSAWCYLQCLHGFANQFTLPHLCEVLGKVFQAIAENPVDPAARADLAGEIHQTLKYLCSMGMLEFRRGTITLYRDAILSTPELDGHYQDRNPVKYLANQVLHLDQVLAIIEEAVLTR
ncbi:MAG: 1-acyl-sn-glycerol-3-phosphate acyltransferase [Candidatus Hydrogenedentes bacterium]|nr:1-acyl-sn-glycerol-3-phosphate acyltransferase [Candidatus Hydrogenedentota bacterium]